MPYASLEGDAGSHLRDRGLFSAQFIANLCGAMQRWSARQMLAFFLVVFVTLGMSLSAVRASDMAAKMTMSSEMGGSSHGDCDGCSGDAGKAKAMACASSFCATSVLAVLPQAVAPMPIEKPISFFQRYSLLHGWSSPLDPYPPRSSDLG